MYATTGILLLGFVVEMLGAGLAGGLVYVVGVLFCAMTPARFGILHIATAATILGVADRVPLALAGELTAHHFAERSAVLAGVWMIAALVRQRALDVSAISAARDTAQSYLDLVDVIVLALDRQGHITMLNRAGCELLGVEEHEVIGDGWIERFIPPAHRPRAREMVDSLLSGDAPPGTVEATILTASGERRRTLWRTTTLRSRGGEITGTLGSGMDVTELRRAERALEQARDELKEKASLARLGEMAAVVAHEVKNPLAGLRGTLQILESRAGADATDREVIGAMIRRIDGLNRIVEELLSFARPNVMDTAPVPLLDVVGRVLEVAASGRPELFDVSSGREQCLVEADSAQLEQALLNVMLNAVEACSGSPGAVRVRVEPDATGCAIRVRDDGPGIPEGIRDRVFEPFVTTRSRGTGLGLPVAKRIVEGHEGTLSLEEVEGGGVEAVVWLPRVPGAGAASGDQSMVSRSARSTST